MRQITELIDQNHFFFTSVVVGGFLAVFSHSVDAIFFLAKSMRVSTTHAKPDLLDGWIMSLVWFLLWMLAISVIKLI